MAKQRRNRLGLAVDDATSKRLGKVRQRDTAPELLVRKLATELGARYRVRNRDLPGSPDLANRSRRWAIFTHGCYWHAHRGCPRATVPKHNRDFWLKKFEDNRRRDRRALRDLREQGYSTLVIWECELKRPLMVRERLRSLYRAANRPS